jgi:2-phospho-L-lactate guanylyltransferase
MTLQWDALVPLKPLAEAKSRLELPVRARVSLALAMLLDFSDALSGESAIRSLTVVTRDPTTADRVERLGIAAALVAGVRGLNEELMSVGSHGTSDRGTLVALPDLATLRSRDLARVLSGATTSRGSFVADLQGVGTTMLLTPPGCDFAPRFGPDSRRAHSAIADQVMDAPMQARLDVDTTTDLRTAVQFGLGPAGRRWLRANPHRSTLALGWKTEEGLPRCHVQDLGSQVPPTPEVQLTTSRPRGPDGLVRETARYG